MILLGEQVFDRSLLNGAQAKHFRNASYYLTIGQIVPVGDREESLFEIGSTRKTWSIKPKEMIWVVSSEEFRKGNEDVSCLATLRTTLTKNGLLALNTGIIDPNFSGPIGTAIINFSSKEVPIRVGDEFMRIIFIKHGVISDEFRAKPYDRSKKEYLFEVQELALSKFPTTFLDAQDISEEFYDRLADKWPRYLLKKASFVVTALVSMVVAGVIGALANQYLVD
ncbi:hypothetical protein [Minwuia thermotolerans]|nr:hypothetical protein [Minwuia thermotolerans]